MSQTIDNHGKLISKVSEAAFLSKHGYASTIACPNRKAAVCALAELHRSSHNPDLTKIKLTYPIQDFEGASRLVVLKADWAMKELLEATEAALIANEFMFLIEEASHA